MGLVDPGALGLRSHGRNLRIFELARITSPHRVSFGDEVIVDDFSFIQGEESVAIGSYVHVGMFVSITGGGTTTIGDFVSMSPGVRILSGTDDPTGPGLLNPTVPPELRSVVRTFADIGAHAYLGANTVVLPGVRVAEGAALGANSLVREDLEPWTLYVGSPCRPLRSRPRDEILARAARLTG